MPNLSQEYKLSCISLYDHTRPNCSFPIVHSFFYNAPNDPKWQGRVGQRYANTSEFRIQSACISFYGG